VNTERIHLPAEVWESLTHINSCSLAVEQKPGTLISVHAEDVRGKRYTAFGTMYRGTNSVISAWEMLPESLYPGETTDIYHDEQAIAEGRRDRGDMRGLRVKHKGTVYVLASRADLVKDLPSPSVTLTMAEAEAHERNSSSTGWRSSSQCTNPVFEFRSGRVFANYQNGDGEIVHVIAFRVGKKIVEDRVADDVYALLLESKAPLASAPDNVPLGQNYSLF
jgi:hypothetical protein